VIRKLLEQRTHSLYMKEFAETSGDLQTAWTETAKVVSFSALKENIEADVCVVGGGISGITTAYLLNRAGKKVVLLEDGSIGSGETSRTTAHLTNAFDDRYFEMERMHSKQDIRILADSHSQAIDLIEKLVRTEAIDCDFERVPGYLFIPPGETLDILYKERDAAHRAGLTDVQFVEVTPLGAPALLFPDQAQFHILKYLSGLASRAHQQGVEIYTHTHVDSIEEHAVKTLSGHTVTAKHIVVATNSPVHLRFAIHTKQAPYRTYVVALRIPKGSVPKALYWDTGDPYHYVRIQETDHGDLLIVGGEDHKTGQENDGQERLSKLIDWAQQTFGVAGTPVYSWSGQVMEPVDGVAYIGKSPGKEEDIYIITGDSGNGMTHGTLAGIILTDLITGKHNHWAELYDPKRITMGAAKEYARENLNVAVQYADHIRSGDVDSSQKIAPGEGAVVHRGTKKIAMYKDERGHTHECSAVCTHAGCVVHWNSTEKSWDCPCHGSRFNPYGKVLNGPAIADLEITEKEDESEPSEAGEAAG
jgi:glycine/D-amino acid oxidase-like deaminating enzyme/nitrite reductase/ring-hydroxylating ferredoxin subunit